MSSDDSDDFNSKIALLLIGLGSAAFVVTVYHCISMGWCNRYRGRASRQRPQRDQMDHMDMPSSFENSAAQLIPAYKYQKNMGLVDGDGETCAICLSEFEEGDELRTLPECMHSYHVECIDMWLYSHVNCPMCRTDAIASPQILLRAMDLGSEAAETNRNIGMLPNIVIHSQS